MKHKNDLKPNFAPCYAAAMYPGLCSIFQSHGYALAVHGSLARDLDLIAIPWNTEVSSPETVLESVTGTYAVKVIEGPCEHPHGRIVYTLGVGFGECAIDLGFMPSRTGYQTETEAVKATIPEKSTGGIYFVNGYPFPYKNKLTTGAEIKSRLPESQRGNHLYLSGPVNRPDIWILDNTPVDLSKSLYEAHFYTVPCVQLGSPL